MDVNTITTRVDAAVHAPPPRRAWAPRPEVAAERPAGTPPERPIERPADTPAERPASGRGADLKFTLRSADTEAKFAIHEATNTVMVTITDRKTGEVIREIPSRAHLDLVAALEGKGNLIDTAQ